MTHELFMRRCIELASFGSGFVAPNPMVGALLVYEGRIIGEGWHQQFGKAHAEVNCITSVKVEDGDLISKSTLYVSLEPCAHHGKTPPCTDLIIEKKIPKVIIGALDLSKEMKGKGIKKLQAANVEVEYGVLEKECMELNKRFNTFHSMHRPYIILKWAQTADGFMATSPQTPFPRRGAFEDSEKTRLLISNDYSNRLVHKWRSEEASILIGTNTALLDDPELTNRYWSGPSPVRLVIDMELKLPSSLKVFAGQPKTIIFNSIKHDENGDSVFYQITSDVSLIHQVINALCHLKIQSVLVEGGAKLLQSFIDESLWDEVRTITSDELRVTIGLAVPELVNAIKTEEHLISTDKIKIYKSKNSDNNS